MSLIDCLNLFENPFFLFNIQLLCFICKASFLIFLLLKAVKSPKIQQPLFFLTIILISGIIIDSSWLIKFIHNHYFNFDYRYLLCLLRIAWAFNLIQILALGFFIETLGEKSYKIRFHQMILILLNIVLITYFIFVAFFHFDLTDLIYRSFELKVMSYSAFYMLQLGILPSFYYTIKRVRSYELPKILKRQLTVFLQYFIAPYILTQLLESFTPLLSQLQIILNTISTPLLTFALVYSIIKVMGIRFLNFQRQVQAKPRFNFMNDFTTVLEHLSSVSSINELNHITQTFFKDAFKLIPHRTQLYVRMLETHHSPHEQKDEPTLIELIVEQHVNTHNDDNNKTIIHNALKEQKIIIYDDIAFNNFYEDDQINRELLHFMDRINADIFLPIYDKHAIIAYVIVERDARSNKLYSNVECSEILVFGRYLGNIINLLQNRNLNRLIQCEKELREELYHKHQEINQYRESIRSFMRENKQRKIGLIFYKNKRFIFGNKDAQELININLNASDGHHLTKEIKQLVQYVEEYKSNQSCLVKDVAENHTLVLSALAHMENNTVIIMVYYPELSDILRQQIERLQNPSEWDYLLYLETTKSGQLINQLIPSTGNHLLNFKIELLKMALSKKALLLQMPDDDLMPTVEILHHISVREQLHVLKLSGQVQDNSLAITLFGINPLLAPKNSESLLEKLNNTGTLFIHNIHFLDPESQHHLAEYIKYGFYHVYKSDQRVTSNVRIICSTNQNLSTLVQENKFSKQLYYELKHTTLTMPSLTTLPEHELNELTQGFSDQAITTPLLNNLLELSPKEKHKLIHSKPLSLHELKEKIRTILLNKSKQSNIYEETYFDPSYNVADPVLVEAAKMGKKALQDPKIMGLLWNKFKNQNKIATFLGVNRSSVNRRCKDYNLQ